MRREAGERAEAGGEAGERAEAGGEARQASEEASRQNIQGIAWHAICHESNELGYVEP